jgi:hypothetical protein
MIVSFFVAAGACLAGFFDLSVEASATMIGR